MPTSTGHRQPPKSIEIALAYDFDGTLVPGNMQEHGFMQSVGIHSAKDFWSKSENLEREHDADRVLAYMLVMKQKMVENKIENQYKFLQDQGKNLPYFPGVEDWFAALAQHAKSLSHKHNIEAQLSHYVISSGNEEIISGCSIRQHFKKVYASRFHFDSHGQAMWPSQMVDYTTKTQYLFRINKGTLGHNDKDINKHMPQSKRPVPFDQMIFIGDGMTDIPCFRTVKSHGGSSVAVCGSGLDGKLDKKGRQQIESLVADKRILNGFAADYRVDQPLFAYICDTIERIILTRKLHAGALAVLDVW